MSDRTEGTSRRYWFLILALVALGFLTIFSIGLYFWFIALGLVVMSPFRGRPEVFRSGMAFVLGFLLGYVLIAPFGCSQTMEADAETGQETASQVVCTSPIGLEYSGTEPFNPSLAPALLVALATGVVASVAVFLWLRLTPVTDARQPSQ